MKRTFYRTLDAFIRLSHQRTLFVLGSLFAFGTALTLWELFRLSNELVETTALRGSQLHSEILQELRTIYTSEVVDRAREKGIEVTHDYERRPGAIPLPVTLSMKLAQKVGELGTGIHVKILSDYPFPWRRDRPPLDDFERAALAALRIDPERPYYRFERVSGQPTLRFATADRMRPQCISCHNTLAASPKKDWKVGDVRGIIEIVRPIGLVAAQTHKNLRATFIGAATVIVLGLLGLSVVASRLKRTSLELEERVARRTADLELANKELESFNYSVSHDLRTPLTSIGAFSQMLLDEYGGRLDQTGLMYVNRIVGASRRMNDMAEDLLKMSSTTHGVLKRQQVDLSDLARSIGEELRARDPKRSVEFSVQPGLQVNADPKLLRLALENLIGNAWKYTSKKERARISVGVAKEKDLPAYFIKDNGAGFDMKDSGRLFGAFQRLHTAEEFPGTGIGLGTVKRVIDRHGGRIWAESRPGEGAAFYFTLPEPD